MIVTNTNNVPGKEVTSILGIVQGNVMGTRAVGEPLLETVKKAVVSTLAWGPKVIIGEEVGLVPEEEMREKKEEGEKSPPSSSQDALEGYSQLLYQLREKAQERMIENAKKLGADGVINIHFGVNVILMHAFEVYAYGTAVKLA